MKIALLASGGLGAKAVEQVHNSRHDLVAVLTDKGSSSIQDYCIRENIKIFVGNPRGGKCCFPSDLDIDLLLSVNYLFIIERDLIEWPNLFAVNIHGSLLPKYRGRTPHVWAIINNEKETGITAHIMDAGCDTGDILIQRTVPIESGDTGADLLEKYAAEYPTLIEQLLNDIEGGILEPVQQEEWRSTYYGKRTPESGEIDWNWQRERVKNWVRAQAYPYPGAFTFIQGEKVTIDMVSFSDYGFNYEQPNGLVLATTPDVVIKTTNGALKVESFREQEVKIKIGDVLGK